MTYTDATDKYKDLVAEVIEERDDLSHLAEHAARIAVVECDTRKDIGSGKVRYADARRVSGIWAAFVPFDFLITLYMPDVEALSPDKLKTLFWHELKHCGVNPASGDFCLVPHDTEEFMAVIREKGLNWATAGEEDE